MIDSETPRGPITRRQSWMLASRPRTLPAALAPVIVGTALAIRDAVFDPFAAIACLLAALLLQIASNFANDLGDFERGTDTPERVGPLRVTTAGLLSAGDVKRGIVVVLALAAVCGVYLILVGGWPILAVGLLSMLAAVAYTYGPIPFGYYGLGDLATFVFFGFVAVVGTYYVQAAATASPTAPLLVWIAAIPMGALVTAILVVNNVRDADTDRAAGKRTLAVTLGRRGARIEYVIMLALAYAVPFVLWLGFGMSLWVLLPLLTIPLAIRHAASGLDRPWAAPQHDAWRHCAVGRLVCAGVCVRHHRRPVPCRHMRVTLARARNGARLIAGSRRLPEVRRPLALVAPRLRNCLTVFSPLLFAWLAALAIMPVTQWSAGHLGLLAGVYLGVLLQSSLVVVYLAQAAGIRRATADRPHASRSQRSHSR